MAARRSSSESDAVSRRLSLLSAELAAVRGQAEDGSEPLPDQHTNPRGRPLWAATEGAPAETDEAPEIPRPGRHAARSRDPRSEGAPDVGSGVGALPRRVGVRPPDPLRGPRHLTGAHVGVVALLVAVGLVVTAWWTMRAAPTATPLPQAATAPGLASHAPGGTMPPGASVSAGSPTAAASEVGQAGASSAGATVVVDVAGRVRDPGIVVLSSGSRVVDALEAAGGARRGVDLSTLNQARLLVDGEQILVGIRPAPGLAATETGSGGPSSSTGPATLVNLNTAAMAELETLPGVGPVTAQAIIDWRTANGGFTSVDELLEIDGIGDATLADLAPYVTI